MLARVAKAGCSISLTRATFSSRASSYADFSCNGLSIDSSIVRGEFWNFSAFTVQMISVPITPQS